MVLTNFHSSHTTRLLVRQVAPASRQAPTRNGPASHYPLRNSDTFLGKCPLSLYVGHHTLTVPVFDVSIQCKVLSLFFQTKTFWLVCGGPKDKETGGQGDRERVLSFEF